MSIVNIEISPFDYVNFSCKKGDSFTKSLEALNDDGTDFVFTDYTAKMEVRDGEGGSVIETFDSTDSSIILTDGLITLDKDEITSEAGFYNYDLYIITGGRKRTIVEGNFTIRP